MRPGSPPEISSGCILEEKLAIGMLIIRVITPHEGDDLIQALNQKGYGATIIEATGATGHVHVIFSVIQRSQMGKVVELIQQFCPKAFYSVEDVRYAREGIFPDRDQRKTGVAFVVAAQTQMRG